MNKNSNFHHCSQCKNDFPEQEVYRIGIKNKEFFCRECAKNIKSECMWCGKELAQQEWQRLGGGSGIKAEEGKLADTIDHDDHRKEKHYKYYLCCEETREDGMRPNQSCPSRINDWWVDRWNQRYQDRQNQGWKECAGKGVYYKDPKTGKVIDLNCYKLVPPGQKYCSDDSCVYYTAVYNGAVSEKEKRIKEKWKQRDQEKYQKANEWWNSLSLTKKQAKLKEEEEHLNNLGLQRQRCWLENIDQNSILFENGKLYYDNMDKIPPSFLHKFGLPGYQWESVWKNDGNQANTALHKVEIDKEIDKKEVSLKQAKKNGDNEMVAKLEQQIQELKNQKSKNNSAPKKFSLIPWIVVSSAVVALGVLVYWIWRKSTKTKL
jgi:hypothetical protein